MSGKTSVRMSQQSDNKSAVNEPNGSSKQDTDISERTAVNSSSIMNGQDTPIENKTAELKVLLPGNSKNSFKQKTTSNEYLFDPWVPDTLTTLRSSGVVLVPSKVFFRRPDYISPFFNYDKWVLVYEDVNVMMNIPMMQQSDFGTIDSSGNGWKITANTQNEVSDIISRLKSRPSVIQAVLSTNHFTSGCSELGVVLFLAPESRCISMVIEHLQEAKRRLKMKRRYVIDVDLADAVVQWSAKVLHRTYDCVGGKFRISGGLFSQSRADKAVGSGCFSCLQKKNKVAIHMDVMKRCDDTISIVGSKGVSMVKQKLAFIQLMTWVESVPSPVCDLCGKLMIVSGNQECDEIHQIYRNRQQEGSPVDDGFQKERMATISVSTTDSIMSDCLETIFETENEFDCSLISSLATSRLAEREKTMASLKKQEEISSKIDASVEAEHNDPTKTEPDIKIMDDDQKYQKWLRKDRLFYLPEYSFERYFNSYGDNKQQRFLGDHGDSSVPEVSSSVAVQSPRCKQQSGKQTAKKSLSKSLASKMKVGAEITQSNNLPIKAKCLEKEYQIPLQMYFKYAQTGEKRNAKIDTLKIDNLSSHKLVIPSKTNNSGSKYSCSGNNSKRSTNNTKLCVNPTKTAPHCLDDVNEAFFVDVLPYESAVDDKTLEMMCKANLDTLTNCDTCQAEDSSNRVPQIISNGDSSPSPQSDKYVDSQICEMLTASLRRIADAGTSHQSGTVVPSNSPISFCGNVIDKTSELLNQNVCGDNIGCGKELNMEQICKTNSTSMDRLKDKARKIQPGSDILSVNNCVSCDTVDISHSLELSCPPNANTIDDISETPEHDCRDIENRIDTNTGRHLLTNEGIILAKFPTPLSPICCVVNIRDDISFDSRENKIVNQPLHPETTDESKTEYNTEKVTSSSIKVTDTDCIKMDDTDSNVEQQTTFTDTNVVIPWVLGVEHVERGTNFTAAGSPTSSSLSERSSSSDSNKKKKTRCFISKRDNTTLTSPDSILRLSRESLNEGPMLGINDAERASIQAATRENTWVTSQENSPTTHASSDLTSASPDSRGQPETDENTPVISCNIQIKPITAKSVEVLQKNASIAPNRRRDAFQEIELDMSRATRYSFREGKSADCSLRKDAQLSLTNGDDIEVKALTERSEVKVIPPRPKRPPGFVHPFYRDITDLGESVIIPNKCFDIVNFLNFKSESFSDDF